MWQDFFFVAQFSTIQDSRSACVCPARRSRRDGGAAARGHGQEQAQEGPATRPPERPLGRWTKLVLAGLPAAEQLQKSEKLRDLFAKGKQKGKLDSDEITEVLDELDLDDDGRERVYNSLDALGVDYISGVIEPDDLDEPPLEAIAK